MFTRLVLIVTLCLAGITHVQAEEEVPADPPPAASPKSEEPTLQELADRMAAAHAQGAKESTDRPSPPRNPPELMRPDGITRRQLVLRQTLGGVGTATVIAALTWTALPVTLVLLPVLPFATSGVVQAIGTGAGGQGRYGRTLLGSLGGMGVGLAVGLLVLPAVASTGGENGDLGPLITGLVLFTASTALGTAAGSVIGYHASDRNERKRPHSRVQFSGHAAPSTHGVLAGISGRF